VLVGKRNARKWVREVCRWCNAVEETAIIDRTRCVRAGTRKRHMEDIRGSIDTEKRKRELMTFPFPPPSPNNVTKQLTLKRNVDTKNEQENTCFIGYCERHGRGERDGGVRGVRVRV
jgi:hypothetical protein